MAKRSLKRTARGGPAEVKPVKKPQCGRHKHDMIFDKTRIVWMCPDPGCKIIAHPPSEVGGAKPVSFKPPFELTVIRDSKSGEETILLRKEKVFFDITELVGIWKETQSAGVTVSLYPSSLVLIDENGRAVK